MARTLLHSVAMSAMPMPSSQKPSSPRVPGSAAEEMKVKELDTIADPQSTTSSMVVAFEIRQRIARDHALLRSLTRALLGAARAAEQDEKQRYVIREILGQLLDETDRHFEYEERTAAPLLREAATWGPICAHRMAEEHEEQRTTLRALAEDAEDGVRSIAELTDEIRWFFRRFEQDMSDEEERLTSAGRFASSSVAPPPPSVSGSPGRR